MQHAGFTGQRRASPEIRVTPSVRVSSGIRFPNFTPKKGELGLGKRLCQRFAAAGYRASEHFPQESRGAEIAYLPESQKR